ncbi:hypothetical protein FA13DRAFT_1907807 [Coprinellus micaceus]|uniref:Uncharacterized protein n=1 Tax=Coprinellus micaceus TaxID=71717 RepID=A0A4Y7R5R2_COPMI|nr:hypothetical protein FA13DRAFT_1907807 [Coprinellus micaceus]
MTSSKGNWSLEEQRERKAHTVAGGSLETDVMLSDREGGCGRSRNRGVKQSLPMRGSGLVRQRQKFKLDSIPIAEFTLIFGVGTARGHVDLFASNLALFEHCGCGGTCDTLCTHLFPNLRGEFGVHQALLEVFTRKQVLTARIGARGQVEDEELVVECCPVLRPSTRQSGRHTPHTRGPGFNFEDSRFDIKS